MNKQRYFTETEITMGNPENELINEAIAFIASPTPETYDKFIFNCQSYGLKYRIKKNGVTNEKIDKLIATGSNVFGSSQRFHAWLWTDSQRLNFTKPISLIADGKIENVLGLLGEIEHGTYS